MKNITNCNWLSVIKEKQIKEKKLKEAQMCMAGHYQTTKK